MHRRCSGDASIRVNAAPAADSNLDCGVLLTLRLLESHSHHVQVQCRGVE